MIKDKAGLTKAKAPLLSLLVIVNDLNVIRIAIAPAEAKPPLVVDANAVLALTVSL